ncbi:hypothetical protein Glove_217g290 [Diversispora epigaea]|uniref:BTB domain-containing protein n=1 Tax=Diversispora epigaea TaxID=1348612 RepID=A0A397IPP4_9GLOM|nr:hypothetical protein Glove_217g290 [Diversispora epigaea]
MTFQFLEDFTELLNDKKKYNVVIEVDQEQNKKTFTAHSSVLSYRSSYFNKELTKNTISKDDDNNTIKIITKPDISSLTFEIILKYIYGGIIDIEMIAANELEFEELSEKLENFFIKSKASWLKTHFFLLSILNRDNLQIKESEIWDYVIEWGITQNPTLPEKLEEWFDENFMTLKTTLQQCLPLIRFFHISSFDVMDKVKPYNKILDKQLWNDLEQHFILPDQPVKSIILPPRLVLTQELPARVYNAFSTIINKEHAAIISSWIDNRTVSYSFINNPYEFQLILRGSKDGFSPRTFWDTCDGHADTIVVTKVEGTNEIIGGFNPLSWNKTKIGYMKTNKSFIFSFKDNIQNPIISRVKDEYGALWYSHYKGRYGPYFGHDEFVMYSDASSFTRDKQNWCKSSIDSCYEKSIRTTNDEFSIIDYEVFKVVSKSTWFNLSFFD